jgi:ATP-binding cassette, subfamily B, bacterial
VTATTMSAVPARSLPGHMWAAFRLGLVAAPVVLTLYALLAVAAGAAPVASAALLRAVLDGLVAGQSVLRPAAGLVAVGLVAGVLPAVRGHLNGRLARAVAVRAMDRLYAAMNRITGLAVMESPVFRDRLRMAQQSGRAGPGQLVDDALGVAESLILVGGFLTAMVALNPGLALLAVGAAGPALLAQLRLNRTRAGMLWHISGRARRELHYADLLTSLAAAKELRLLGLGELFRGRMRREMDVANREQARHDTREVLVRTALAVVTAAVAGVGLLWAVREVTLGRLSIGDISMLVAALIGVQAGLGSLVDRFASTHENALLFDHYRRLVDARPDLPSPAEPVAVGPLRAAVELRDVWFRYGADQPWVLRGVSLTIPAGQTVALVGRNGAGKSTVVKLLCRFYDPTNGSVTWDGHDLREVDVASLRDRIGAVFQDFMAYELSAAENVGVGDVAALTDRPRIEAAAGRAGVHGTLAALPAGYDTMLTNAYYGEADPTDPTSGVLLSGGQWQRVALARAFLRGDRDLLMLDEPTAGLDPEAEHELHVRLRRHREGRTSLLISHRLNTVRDADRIVVLADGLVTEEGTHEELLERGGDYARLFTLQADGYQPVVTA